MLIENLLLPGLVVPALGAVVALALTVPAERRGLLPSPAGGSLAVLVAFLSAFVAITGWPRFPPVESTQRMFYGLIVIFALGLLSARLGKAGGWWLRVVAIGLLLWALLKAPLLNGWSLEQAGSRLGLLLVVGLLLLHGFETSLGIAPGRAALTAAGVRLALVAGAAVLLGLSGTVRLAQLMGAVACGVFVVEVVARIRGREPWLKTDSLVLVAALFGLILGGFFFAELEPWPAALLFLAVTSLPLGSRRGWRWLPLLPLALAVGLAVWTFAQREEDPYDGYGSVAPAALGPGANGNNGSAPA